MNELSQLKNYIITSNKYSFLLEGYMELFKKHWGSEVESVVLGFDKPDIELQENFSFHSMGNQDDGRGWCEPLIEFFESCTDDYFLMCFEDHYPIRPIKGEPRQRLIEGLGYLKEKRADKLYLMPDYHDRAASYFEGNWWISADAPHALTTTSLLPSVWRREHLLKLLKEVLEKGGKNPHAFETTLNQGRTGGRELLTPEVCIYANLDAARGGKFNSVILDRWEASKNTGPQPWMQNVEEEDIDVFKRMKLEWNKQNV